MSIKLNPMQPNIKKKKKLEFNEQNKVFIVKSTQVHK